MERRHVSDATMLPGFDGLMFHRYFPSTADGEPETAESNRFYESYHRIHKVFVGESGSRLLKTIHEGLKDEQHPEYLDTAGWAAVESALVDESADTIARLRLIESAEQCWERAIMAQADINERLPDDEVEDDSTFRLALNLAFTPIMKALVVGNVTTSVREQVFADVLALGQLAGIQRDLASKDGHIDAAAQLLGFEHECNAHLVLLFINDPRYLPLPSSSRGGSGTTYPEQTHDISVINQHWGNIRKVVPLEIKSKASLNDIKRYDALVVRGKMHLSITGKYSPEHTRGAFAAYYSGEASTQDNRTVYQVTSMMKELLILYQQGGRQNSHDSPTTYHDLTALRRTHPEFTLNRPERY